MRPIKRNHRLIPCDGEAHSNAYIDNCTRCAPRWGWIEVPVQPVRSLPLRARAWKLRLAGIAEVARAKSVQP